MLVEHLFNSLTPEQREEMLVLILKEQYKICSAFDDEDSISTAKAMNKVLGYNMLLEDYIEWQGEVFDALWRRITLIA